MKTGKRAKREIEGAEHCPRCRKKMKRYEHAGTWQPEVGKYHFTFWDYCKPCRHVQHYESAKVMVDVIWGEPD